MSSSEAQSEAQAPRDVKLIRRPLFDAPADPDTLRILISSDNHLGYAEHDSIRKEDSFITFNEILQHAKENYCDMVLFGGDIFHENKPSRACMYKAVKILRDHCLGDGSVSFQIVSNQAINFPSTKCVNYENPNVNIAMPVFAIHGNHDDPAGAGSYSAIDILHQCNLLNYFGKSERVDKITNYPLLLRKGRTNVALYGIGNIRDERLHRTFTSNEVKWVRPDENRDEWYNMVVVHQNRTQHTQLQKNYIHEGMLPKFLDLVIWGHEHECIIEPEPSVTGDFLVVQPGSSVATSLSAGEAVEKKVGILEIRGDESRMLSIPLATVRPFLMGDCTLSNELDPTDPEAATMMDELLVDKINALIEKAKSSPTSYHPARPTLPLIRLRVEHTGFPKLNVQRFGQKFVGRVANCEDLLQFYKQRKAATKSDKDKSERTTDYDILARNDKDAAPPIHDLVTRILQRETPLSILSERQMSDAIQKFVEKNESTSIAEFVRSALQSMQHDLKHDNDLVNKDAAKPDDIEKLVKKRHDTVAAEDRKAMEKEGKGFDFQYDFKELEQNIPDANVNIDDLDLDGEDEDGADGMSADDRPARARGRPARGRGATSTRARGRGRGAKTGTESKKRTPAKSRSKKKQEEDEEEDEPAPRARARAAPRSARKSYAEESDDDELMTRMLKREEEDDDQDEKAPPAKKSRATAPTKPKPIAAAAKSSRMGTLNFTEVSSNSSNNNKKADVIDDDDDIVMSDKPLTENQAERANLASDWGGINKPKRKPRAPIG